MIMIYLIKKLMALRQLFVSRSAKNKSEYEKDQERRRKYARPWGLIALLITFCSYI
jgi:hypothetical protein